MLDQDKTNLRNSRTAHRTLYVETTKRTDYGKESYEYRSKGRNMYCPICGEVTIRRAETNAPVKDYVCEHCGNLMNEGWFYEGIENYCSDACLKAAHSEIDIDMLKVHAIEDNSNSYWTKWE